MKKISIDGLIGFLSKSKEIKSVTQIIDPKKRVRVTKRSKHNKAEFLVNIGKMNYSERDLYAKLKKKGSVPNHMVWTYPKKRIK